MHSQLFGRCIGVENVRPYFTFLLLNFILFSLYMSMNIFSFNDELESTIFIVRPIEAIYRLWCYSKVLFIVFMIVQGVAADIVEELLPLVVAISRKITIKELMNVWAHKHCFKVTTIDDGRNFFTHKYYSLWALIKNVSYFLLGKSKHSNAKRDS